MSKLNCLRKWLSLEEAAKYLENKIEEQVAVTDVLRFALDGHLTLSVNLQSPKIAKKVEIQRVKMHIAAKYKEVYVHDNWGVYVGESFSPERLIDFAVPLAFDLTSLSGVQDTPLLGIERLFAEEQYCDHLRLPKPSKKQDLIRGVTISAGPTGLFQLQEFINVDRELESLYTAASVAGDINHPAFKNIIGLFESIKSISMWDPDAHQRYIPAPTFPEDVYFVARTPNLDKLVETLNTPSITNKPKQSKKTVNAQAKFIKNLLILMYDEDVAKNPRKYIDGKMAQIRTDLESKGLHCPSGVTVENWLSDID
ncbi:hypothetical protein [Serratia sp. P2ACOL2]|uniref:hypothetical protein n=1 Tax=Serratia sp. P2ACOL2 TaxID=2482769 RepID=UPI000EFA7334|nr:hypothetical protein [Serratia sp. P2ACOL2]AYO37302.1 hypothetical protein EBA31_08330 [Serratia sp. P2ACOL2]